MEENTSKPFEITAKLLDLNVLNLNKRFYSLEAAEKMVEIFNRHKSTIGDFYGSLGYEGYEKENSINLKDISHRTTSIWIEDDSIWGTISVLNNERGKLLTDMIKSGSVVFRPRSNGTVNSDGSVILKELISFDAIPREEDAFGNVEYKFIRVKQNGNR